MKKSILCVAGFTMMTLAFTSCKQEAAKENATETSTEKAAYSCPMHPEEKSDQPGACSKCGMDLEKAEQQNADSLQGTTDSSGHEHHEH